MWNRLYKLLSHISTNRIRRLLSSRLARITFVLIVFAAYGLAYLPLRARVGVEVGLLAGVPVALNAWFFGLRGGLLAGLGVPLFHTLLLNLAGHSGWDVLLHETDGLGILVSIAIGAIVGRCSDLARVLRESTERFHRLVEASTEGIVIHERGEILDANPALATMFGYSIPEMLGRNVLEFAAHESHDLISQTILSGHQKPYEALGLRKDGTKFPVEILGRSILYEGRRARVAIIHDLTGREQAEMALRQSEERYRQLVEFANDIIYRTDANGLFTFVNPTALRVMKCTEAGLIGRSYLDVIRPDYRQTVRRFYRSQFARRLPNTYYEFPAVAMDRTEVWLGQNVQPIMEAGRITGFQAVAREITERKRAEEEIKRRAEEFVALYETARDLAAQHDLPTLLNTVAERARALLYAPGGGIYLYDAARGDLELVVVVGAPVPVGTRLHMGEGMAGRVAQARQPLIVNDYHAWEGRSPQYEGIPFRAILQVPMLYAGELIGVLVVHEMAESERKFTEADAHLLSLFAGQAASAVHNTRLFNETRRRSEEMAALEHISAALRVVQTLDEMLPHLLDETLAVLATDAGAIWLYDPAHAELRQAIARGWFRQLSETPMQPGEGIAGMVFASGEAHLSREFVQDPRTRASTRHQIPPGWGGACIPIRTAAQVVGVLFAAVPLPREFTPEEMHLLMALAEIAGNAIHRMRLLEQTEQRLQRLEALRAIDMLVTASLDLNLTLNILLDHTLALMRVDAAAVLLLDSTTQTLAYAAVRGFRGNALMHTRLGEGYANRAVLERAPISVPDLRQRQTGPLRTPFLAGEDFIAYYGVPLIAKGAVKGVLELFHRAPLTPDSEWLDFLETLADQAAIAIDNAELYEGLQRSNAKLALAYDATIEGWARALELRAHETAGHTQRVTELTERLARSMGITEAELAHIRRGAMLHDIGKMGIPDTILLKPGPLTEEEWVLMRRHPQFAYMLLSPIAFLRPALDIPRYHHERWDGTGYPDGLKGEQIPLAARIFAIVDVWDALNSSRPYRPAWSEEHVREHIRSLTGVHFDPKVVEIFMELEPMTRGEQS